MNLHHLAPCPKCDGKMLMSVKIKKGTLIREGLTEEEPEGTLYFICNRIPSHRYLQRPGGDLIEAKGLRIREWEKIESSKKTAVKGKKTAAKKASTGKEKPAGKKKAVRQEKTKVRKPAAAKPAVKTKTPAKARKSPGKIKSFSGKTLPAKTPARTAAKPVKKVSPPAARKKTAAKTAPKTSKKNVAARKPAAGKK